MTSHENRPPADRTPAGGGETGSKVGLALGVGIVVVALIVKLSGGLVFLNVLETLFVFGGVAVGVAMVGFWFDSQGDPSTGAVSTAASAPVIASAAGRWVPTSQWVGYGYGRTSGRVAVRCNSCSNQWTVENRLSNTLALEQEQLIIMRRRHDKHYGSVLGSIAGDSPYAREARRSLADLEHAIGMTISLLSCSGCGSAAVQLKS